MRTSAEIKADIADRESQLSWAEKTGFFEDIDDNAKAVFLADKQAELDDLHEELAAALKREVE